MGWYPCGCCDDCGLFSDDFDREDSSDLGASWQEDSGDWEISSSRLTETTGNGAAKIVTDLIDQPEIVIEADWIPGATARLCIGYTDANNYLALSVSPGGNLQLIHREGGSDSTLASIGTAFAFASWHLRLCYDGESARAVVYDQDRYPLYEVTADVSISDVGAGLTLTGGGQFDNVAVLRHHTDAIPSCKRCVQATSCCPGEIPDDRPAFVDLTGAAFTSNGHCGSVCADLAALFEVPNTGLRECRWLYIDEQFCEMDVGDFCAEWSDHTPACPDYFWKLRIDVGFSPCLLFLELQITGECSGTGGPFDPTLCGVSVRYEFDFEPPDDPSAEAEPTTYNVPKQGEFWRPNFGDYRLCLGDFPDTITITI